MLIPHNFVHVCLIPYNKSDTWLVSLSIQEYLAVDGYAATCTNVTHCV